MVCSAGLSVSPTAAADDKDDIDGPFSWEWMIHESVHDRSDDGAASGRLVRAARLRPDSMEWPGGSLERGDGVGGWPRSVGGRRADARATTPAEEGEDVDRTGRHLVPPRAVSAGD